MLEQLTKTINEALEKCQPAYGHDMFLVVGQTGAGKSTTINYLARYPMVMGDGGVAEPEDPSIPMPCNAQDSPDSVTLAPAAVLLQEGFVVCDCPGFADNRGDDIRITASVCTEAVVKNAQSIRGLVVVLDWHAILGGKSESFRDAALAIGSLIRQDANVNLQQSVMFVLTKGDPRKDKLGYLETKKLPDSIKKLKQDLAALTNRMESVGSTLMLRGASSQEDQQEAKKDEIVSALSVLTLLQKQLEDKKVVNCDVFDEGQSRGAIFNIMRTLVELPKEVFDFSNADAIRKNFTDQVRKNLVHAVDNISKLKQLPNEIGERTTYYDKLSLEVFSFMEQKDNLNQPGFISGENNPAVISNRQKLAENNQRFYSLNDELEQLRGVIRESEIALGQLDTSEEVVFDRLTFARSRYNQLEDMSSMTFMPAKGAAAVAVMGHQFANDSNNAGSLLGSAAGSLVMAAGFATATGLAVVGGATALLTTAMTSLTRIKHHFEYKGAPYTRAEQHGAGEFIRIECKPAEGIYHVKYKSPQIQGADASVSIYGEKRHLPTNKIKIEQLILSLASNREKVTSVRGDQQHIQGVNQQLVDMINSLILEGQIGIEKQKIQLDSIITQTRGRLQAVEGEIRDKRNQLNELNTQLSEQSGFFNMVIALSPFIDFDSVDHPRLVQTIRAYVDPTPLLVAVFPAQNEEESEFDQEAISKSRSSTLVGTVVSMYHPTPPPHNTGKTPGKSTTGGGRPLPPPPNDSGNRRRMPQR